MNEELQQLLQGERIPHDVNERLWGNDDIEWAMVDFLKAPTAWGLVDLVEYASKRGAKNAIEKLTECAGRNIGEIVDTSGLTYTVTEEPAE